MVLYKWDKSKNERLLEERDISFEDILLGMQEGRLLDVILGIGKRTGQKQLVVEVRGYVYVVPFVDQGDEVFLKTIIPSRKMTRKYLGGNAADE